MVEYLQDFVCVEILAENGKEVFEKYDIDVIPAILIITKEGKEISVGEQLLITVPPGVYTEVLRS